MPSAVPTTAKPAARKAASTGDGSSKTASRAAAKSAGAADKASGKPTTDIATATLTISSRNYSSWSLRGWLLVKLAGLPVQELMVSPDDADARKELLLLAPSIRVPCLTHDGAKVWNTLAIGQYLHEQFPDALLLPADRLARAHARSICGEMVSGFANLRSSLPMNLKAHFPKHKVWAGAQPDIDRICEIWSECLAQYGGPYLFGERPNMADAMFAPVATRFLTYDVPVPADCAAWCQTIMALPEMQTWVAAAKLEPDDIEELDMDF